MSAPVIFVITVLVLCVFAKIAANLNLIRMSEMDKLVIDADIGPPLPRSIVPTNSMNAARVVFRALAIEAVFPDADVTKIAPSIISILPIYMVYLFGPLASHDVPNDSVRAIRLMPNPHLSIPAFKKAASSFASPIRVPALMLANGEKVIVRARTPSKGASFGIVFKQIWKFCVRYYATSHLRTSIRGWLGGWLRQQPVPRIISGVSYAN